MVNLPPANWIDIAEQIVDFRMPTPPQVVRQRHALIVKGFGSHLTWDRLTGRFGEDCNIHLTHGTS